MVGTAGGTKYGYDKDGKPFLTKEPKLLLNDDNAGKPEGIHLEIGRRPHAAFGNSTGDRQMLEYTKAGDGARLSMLVLHDDAKREYAYGPAQGLPDTKVGTFPQALYDEAKKDGWSVISMKDDWKRIFGFEVRLRTKALPANGHASLRLDGLTAVPWCGVKGRRSIQSPGPTSQRDQPRRSSRRALRCSMRTCAVVSASEPEEAARHVETQRNHGRWRPHGRG